MAQLDNLSLVIVHGWSDNARSMRLVGDPLAAMGATVHYVDYDSREDSAVFEDFAEGLNLRLAERKLLDGAPLHIITHSTGALVVRQWLVQYPQHHDRLGNVIFLAPPNFGSPLASTGNTLIGKIFKGQHGEGDSLEVGRKILHGLEIASPYSWRLAEADLFGPRGALFSANRLRAFVICGYSGYGGLRSFINEDGTDGTIVVAGAGLNSRHLKIDFADRGGPRTSLWHGFGSDERAARGTVAADVPLALHKGLNHATILDAGGNAILRDQIVRCLKAGPDDYAAIRDDFSRFGEEQIGIGPDEDYDYQQLVFRVVDERDMPVPDYHLEFNVWQADRLRECYPGGPHHVPRITDASGRVRPRPMTKEETRRSGLLDRMLRENAHVHSQDSGYRRFLLSPSKVRDAVGDGHVLTMKIDAVSGDSDVTYLTHKVENFLIYDPAAEAAGKVKIKPFYPNTTTLVQIRLDRESRLVAWPNWSV